MAWAHERGVRHLINEAGKPTQNAYIEGFNGKFRDECLNEQWFLTLHQALQEISRWRRDYNEVRPHSNHRRSANLHNLGLSNQTLAHLLGVGHTIRTARSWTSGENLGVFLMAPSSQVLEPPQDPG